MLIALPLALVTAASYLGIWWWGLALIAHFRPHMAVLSLVSLGVAVLSRARASGALSLGLLAINIVPLVPYLGIAASAERVPPANLRVLTLNMHGSVTDRSALQELIRSEQPDLVILSEISGGIAALAAEISALPPYSSGEPGGVLDSVVMFGRWPLVNVRHERTPDDEAGVLSATLCASERWPGCLSVVALHAAPPFGAGAATQAQQLEIAAQLAVTSPERRVLLAGDLDLTPWSPAFTELLSRSHLVDSGLRRGLTATWLSRVPFAGLLIDHVLVSPSIAVANNRLGSDVGSDHFPVIVDLAIPVAAP